MQTHIRPVTETSIPDLPDPMLESQARRVRTLRKLPFVYVGSESKTGMLLVDSTNNSKMTMLMVGRPWGP